MGSKFCCHSAALQYLRDHIIPRSSNEESSTWRRPLLRSPVMFSLFRFMITLCVTFAVVQGFCNSHPRWWPNRQQNLAKCTESRDFLERMKRCHISMKESSSSTDISSSPIAKGLQTGNISAFLDFDGESNSISDNHRFCQLIHTGRFTLKSCCSYCEMMTVNTVIHPCERKLLRPYLDLF